MPSPFPGMDPYLEQHWGDVHSHLIVYASNQLQKVLPRGLRARVEERVVVAGPRRPRSVYPDVRVFETNLQALIEQCYEDGGYDDIDFNATPKPPLPTAEARWAAQLLRQAGRRRARQR